MLLKTFGYVQIPGLFDEEDEMFDPTSGQLAISVDSITLIEEGHPGENCLIHTGDGLIVHCQETFETVEEKMEKLQTSTFFRTGLN